MGQIVGTLFGVCYIGIGIVQWFATMDGLEHWFGISGFIAFILSLVIAYFPLAGTISGFIGATNVWGWSNLEAGALFVGPFGILLIISVISAIFDKKA